MQFFIIMLMLVLGVAQPAFAQDYKAVQDAIAVSNHINPRQNPAYEESKKIFDRKVRDNKSKVVGEVQDVVLRRSGHVDFLKIEFDRLKLLKDVYVGYRELQIRGLSNGYELSVDGKEIENMFPTLLANMEPAAGSEESLSIQNIIGSTIKSEKGKTIGKVEEVLFDNRGRRVMALHVSLKKHSFNQKAIAIPFSLLSFDHFGSGKKITVSQNTADAIAEYID